MERKHFLTEIQVIDVLVTVALFSAYGVTVV
jgi:hypothetical protein